MLTQINTPPFQRRILSHGLLVGGRNLQLAGEQLVKAYRSMCPIRKVREHMHMAFTTGLIGGFVHPYAGMHRGHGRSIVKGA